MGHAAIENTTPFSFEHVFLADEEGRPLFVGLLQATYDIVEARTLVLAKTQVPPSITV
jgi:hypothetical protein